MFCWISQNFHIFFVETFCDDSTAIAFSCELEHIGASRWNLAPFGPRSDPLFWRQTHPRLRPRRVSKTIYGQVIMIVRHSVRWSWPWTLILTYNWIVDSETNRSLWEWFCVPHIHSSARPFWRNQWRSQKFVMEGVSSPPSPIPFPLYLPFFPFAPSASLRSSPR